MQAKPKYKICRRLGPGVFEKCQNPKFAVRQGMKTKNSKSKPKALTAFGLQLIEKQKIRYSYGITEKQLGNYVGTAVSTKGATATNTLYELLESRLDNVIYRMGLAETRRKARQMVSHGHILVNGRKNNVPSYKVRVGDKISVREGSKGSPLFQNLDTRLSSFARPTWLNFDAGSITGEVKGQPVFEQAAFNIGTVLEFYSR